MQKQSVNVEAKVDVCSEIHKKNTQTQFQLHLEFLNFELGGTVRKATARFS
jgi:hypothetical protein